MYKKSNKRGFTMAEMLVCLAIISVIATILIPTLGRVKPHKEKTMFKKAYQISERVIYELVNDPELYPTTDINAGFDNVKAVSYNGVSYGADLSSCAQYEEGSTQYDACVTNNNTNGKIKFCRLFALKVNTLEQEPNCSGLEEGIHNWQDYEHINEYSDAIFREHDDNGFPPAFTTTDGVEWYMPITDFEATNTVKLYHPIFIDVNGPKPPNKRDNYVARPSTNAADCTDDMQNQTDRFAILVRADGKMEVPGICARAYLQDMKLMHKTQ